LPGFFVSKSPKQRHKLIFFSSNGIHFLRFAQTSDFCSKFHLPLATVFLAFSQAIACFFGIITKYFSGSFLQ
jgi:hypothetical protein